MAVTAQKRQQFKGYRRREGSHVAGGKKSLVLGRSYDSSYKPQ